MNSKKIISLYLLYGIFILLAEWFNEELFGSIFIGAILVFIFVLFTLWMFIFGLIYPIRCYRSTKRIQMISFVPLCIIVSAILGTMFFSSEESKVDIEHYLYQNLREKVIVDIQNRELLIDINTVKLPLKYRWLSSDGEAFVFADNPESTVIGFWVFRGMLSGSRLVVYNSNPVPPTPELLICGKVQVIKQLTPHWYYLRMD